MPARRCSLCGIDYPATHVKCPVHDENTEYWAGLDPDENWEWKATALLLKVKGASADADGVLSLDVPIRQTENGYHWISSWDVINQRIQHRLPPDSVIAIGPSQATKSDEPDENLYEVIAYVDERREYWIRPLRVPDFPPDE